MDFTHRERTGQPSGVTGPAAELDAVRDGRNSPDVVMISLSVNLTTGQGTGTAGAQFKYPTYMTVTAAGSVTKSILFPAASFYYLNPSGSVTYGPQEITLFRYDQWNTYDPVTFTAGLQTTVLMNGGLSHVNGAARPPHGNESYVGDCNKDSPDCLPRVYCGAEYNNNCFQYSGDGTVTMQRLSADLSVTPQYTSVAPGATPYVDYRATPENLTVNGASKLTPFNVDSTFWIPDADTAGGDPAELATSHAGTGACQAGFGSGCRRKIVGSGTYMMKTFVNGKRITKTAHISAPDLILTANPDSIFRHDTVTFTPSWTDGTPVTGGVTWTWLANSPPGTTPVCGAVVICKVPVRESGKMKITITRGGVVRTAVANVTVWPTFDLIATPTAVSPGKVVAFTPLYRGQPGQAARRWVPDPVTSWDSVAACVSGAKCYRAMWTSGTMWAYASPGAGGDSASAAITVSECSSSALGDFSPAMNQRRARSSAAAGGVGPVLARGSASLSVAGCSDEEEDPFAAELNPIASEIASLVEENPFVLLDIECEQMPEWVGLANHAIPASVVNRLTSPDSGIAITGWPTPYIQIFQNAAGPVVNLDYYGVTVPIANIPNGLTVNGYLNYIRTHINDFVDWPTSFNFYPGLVNEDLRWASTPLGTLFSISLMPILEEGSVVATGYGNDHWIFSTVFTPEDLMHPVSGNRRFGAIDHGNGTATFYTRGADRISTSVNKYLDLLGINIYAQGHDVWVSFQRRVKNALGPSAVVQAPVFHRPRYSEISKVFSGAAPVSTLRVCGGS